MKVHIKFLDHGKGSAAHASAYLLDRFDHRGNVRAGVQVLRGDTTTFNAICHASPHLWKYTSGVIAWSKDDDPTYAQIMEVLKDFEEHAFAGLEQSQYHLFAVLHTDDDGSKHIHVLAPRLDIQSGKSLNIAPPGHEKHFDALRDYFNTKYQWSRPDDLLLMQTTQEPNHVAKLNAQAEKLYAREDIIALTKNQFCKTIDNHVKTLLKTQTIQMNNSKLDFIQSVSEQQQKAEKLQESLQLLSQTLINFEKLIEQSEQPIIESTTLLHSVKRTTIALETHLNSLLKEIGNLSPQAIQTLTESYTAQIQELQLQLTNIDIAEISTVKTSIDSFSISIRELQTKIDTQLQKISIDQTSLQKSIQTQIQQAITNLSKPIENNIAMLITEKLDTQKATYMLGGGILIGLLSLLIALFIAYQSAMNVKTIKAQQQMIQQNAQAITAQISYLNTLRK